MSAIEFEKIEKCFQEMLQECEDWWRDHPFEIIWGREAYMWHAKYHALIKLLDKIKSLQEQAE